MQHLINAGALGSVYAIFALGMSLVWGSLGVLNFAHGAVFVFAAYIASLAVVELALPLSAMVALGAAVGGVVSVAMHVLVFRPILARARDQHAAEMQLLMAGVGLAGIFAGFVHIQTRSSPFSFNGGTFRVTRIVQEPIAITNIQVLMVLVGAVLATLLVLWIRRSRSGLALRAVGVNSETSSIMGIDEGRMGLVAMAVSGVLAGSASILLTYYFGAVAAETADQLLLKAFAAIILGGVGSLVGTVLGSFMLAIAETAVTAFTRGTWVDAVSFAFIFAVLLIRPVGILGVKEVRRT